MTEQQLQALEPALIDFLDHFLFCCGYTQTFAHLGTYIRGLLSDLPRKSVEPIALKAGTPVRTLQQFLHDHDWNARRVTDRLQRHCALRLPDLTDADDLGTVGLIDETSARKKGEHTPGVARQYLGCLGKVDNGIVTVHLGLCRGRYKTLLDADLYLPQSWDQDRDRCRQAGIPDEVVYRPKWKIALEQRDRACGNGLSFDWLTFDEEYGKRPGFLAGLVQRQQPFVGEVPCNFSCLAVTASGRHPPETVPGRKAEQVVRSCSAFRGQSWQVLRLARQTLADQVWRVKAAKVWLHTGEGWSAESYWLLWACNDETGEEKFFVSWSQKEVPVAVRVRVGFRRWNVEHGLRIGKSELGFTHFEGRSYVGLQRHLSLCLVALNFVADQTDRLWGEKSGGDRGTGLPGDADSVPGMAGPAAADERAGVWSGSHQLSPKAKSGRSPSQEKAAGTGPQPQKATAKTKKAQKPISG